MPAVRAIRISEWGGPEVLELVDDAPMPEAAEGQVLIRVSRAGINFADTHVVGPVGDDFGDEEFAVLHGRGVNTDDIERVAGGKTFFWSGRYERDVNVRHTLQTDMKVFETFEPKLSDT